MHKWVAWLVIAMSVLAGCYATGDDPSHPIYVRCVK